MVWLSPAWATTSSPSTKKRASWKARRLPSVTDRGLAGLTLVLARPFESIFTVVDVAGRALAHATAKLESSSPWLVRVVSADEKGEFLLRMRSDEPGSISGLGARIRALPRARDGRPADDRVGRRARPARDGRRSGRTSGRRRARRRLRRSRRSSVPTAIPRGDSSCPRNPPGASSTPSVVDFLLPRPCGSRRGERRCSPSRAPGASRASSLETMGPRSTATTFLSASLQTKPRRGRCPPKGRIRCPPKRRATRSNSTKTALRFVSRVCLPGVYTLEASAEGRTAALSDPIRITTGLSISNVRIQVPEDEAEEATPSESADTRMTKDSLTRPRPVPKVRRPGERALRVSACPPWQ